MISIVYSQWLRTKRMPVRPVTLLCPVLYVGLFSLFLSLSNALRGSELLSFFTLLAMISTFSISFFVPMVYEADKKACMYANDLRIGVSSRKNFLSKFLLISLLLAVIEIIAATGFSVFLMSYMGLKLDVREVLVFIAIQYLALLPMIVGYQFLTLKFSYTGSILTGCFLTLASILLGTTDLGGYIWKYLPFTWGLKLTTLYGKGLISIEQMLPIMAGACILMLLLLWIFSIWYTKWDGLTQMEE